MAVLYQHFRGGQTIEKALEQLSSKYLHIRHGKTGVLDFFFETYLREGKPAGLSFTQWVEKGYDPAELKRSFLGGRKSKVDFDQLLRRE
jgi:protein tyrosine/serine phosphatase